MDGDTKLHIQAIMDTSHAILMWLRFFGVVTILSLLSLFFI